MAPSTPEAVEQSALFVAHPGHELRVYGWLERARPQVHILTDGSGHTAQSRLPSSERLLERAGAREGRIFGRWTDGQAYSALLNHETSQFIDVAEELASSLVEHDVRIVVGDACEGYNPVHDACRLTLDAAVAIARGRSRHPIVSYDFPLTGRPDACPETSRAGAIWLRLDEEAFSRKLEAAFSYPELSGELASAVKESGVDVFRVECLRPVSTAPGDATPPVDPPYYEHYGQKQVEAGHYNRVIRLSEHLVPLAVELRRHVAAVQRSSRCAS